MTQKSFRTAPAASLKGEITIAPDKSISHRALMFAAVAEGKSRVKNLLLGEDVLCTLAVLNRLGVKTSLTAESIKPGDELEIEGVGLKGLRESHDILYCGNSGTAMRLLLGLVSGTGMAARFTGDASLNKRPMGRVTEPLTRMGAAFEIVEEGGRRIIKTLPHGGLRGGDFHLPVASAQIKTAILLAGLNAQGETSVTEPALSRNHTEIMLKAMGAEIESAGTTVWLNPGRALKPLRIAVPGDISSAAFFIVGALIVPGSDVLIRNVNLNPTRTGLLDVVADMGGDVTILNRGEEGGEPVGDLQVRHSRLRNVRVGGAIIPRLIDEIPILALAAAFAEGDMVLSDAKELRVKETDRIQAICRELGAIGADVIEKTDGFTVAGGRALKPRETALHSYGDHRIAMTLIMAGLMSKEVFTIDDADCVNTSFPEFFALLESLRR